MIYLLKKSDIILYDTPVSHDMKAPENLPRSTFFEGRRSSKQADMALASLARTQQESHTSLSTAIHSSRSHGMVSVVPVDVGVVIRVSAHNIFVYRGFPSER